MLKSPSGETTQAVHESVDVTPGENTIKAAFDVVGSEPGIYELSYILTKGDLTLVAGRASFDVAGPSLISMETNQPSYKPGEDVLVLIDAFSAEPAAGQISVYVDGSLAKEEPVFFQGYQWLPANIGRQTLGNHRLKVILSSGAVTGAKTLDFTVADHEAPTTSILYTGQPGRNDWFTSDVTIVLGALDDNLGAGVDRIEYKLDGADWTPYTGPLAFGAEDAHELLYRAVDKAGNAEFAKTKKIKIDKTAPAIIVSSPEAKDYLHSDLLTLDFEATDTVSGAGDVTAELDRAQVQDGDQVDLFYYSLGPHHFVVGASDMAGNEATAAVDFNVVATIQSTIADVEKSYAGGLIDNGLRRSLIAKLEAAQSALNRGQIATANNQLNAFLNEMSALAGKQIDIFTAAVLTNDVNFVISSLGGP